MTNPQPSACRGASLVPSVDRGRRQCNRRWPGVAALLANIVLPLNARALNTCSGVIQIDYTSGVNFPQPVPPGAVGDDLLTVQLTFGAGAIQGGSVLNVHQVNFDLDCVSGTVGSPTACADDGAAIEYGGDASISSDCLVEGNPVHWVSGHAVGTSPNEVQLVPEQSGSPVALAIAGTGFCNVSFDIKVVGRTSNADGFIRQNAFFVGSCDNGLGGSAAEATSFAECPDCIGSACDSDTGECGPGGATTTTLTPTTSTTTTTQPAATLDHFDCYNARVDDRFTPITVTLADEFATRDATVLKPVSICVPVDKNGEGIPDPAARLVCYLVLGGAASPNALASNVTLQNQFGTPTLTVLNGNTLCVPSQAMP